MDCPQYPGGIRGSQLLIDNLIYSLKKDQSIKLVLEQE